MTQYNAPVSSQPDYHIQKKYTGHVSCVRFTSNDSYLITSGGVEAALMQWSIQDSYGDYKR